MRTKTKALLFSALVFPGAGQWISQRYKSALLFMGSAIAATVCIAVKIFTTAWQIKDQIIHGQITPNILTLNQLIKAELYQSNSKVISWAIGAIIIIWLLIMADIFRLKR